MRSSLFITLSLGALVSSARIDPNFTRKQLEERSDDLSNAIDCDGEIYNK
jgi:hypothetical protein